MAYSAAVADERDVPSTEQVALAGQYDISTVTELRRVLYADTTAAEVVADLSGVSFMDSSGLRALLEVHATLESEDRLLVLTGVPDQLNRLFEVAGVNSVFEIR